MQKKHLLFLLLMVLFVPLAVNAQEAIKANRPLQFNPERGLLEMNGTSGTTNRGDRKTAYELVTASQTDWSGNYVLVGPWTTYKGYAFNGEVTVYSGYSVNSNLHLGGITAVTIDGTFLSSIGDAPVLTIAKSTVNGSYYSIRINGGDYLTDGNFGLGTSPTETDESYWDITYTPNGMQIYCPRWSPTNYLYFVVYQDTSKSNSGAMFVTCRKGDFISEGYNFEYVSPLLYKETTLAQHNITVTQSAGGTISASPTTAYMGDMITLSATPETGYFFVEWIVKDASNNTIYVTNNKITMPNSDVTVTASFRQGFHVTLVQTANGTINADQTTNLHHDDHVTLTAIPNNGRVFLAWYVYKTGNPRDVIPVVNNEFSMPLSDVTVQAVFKTEEGEHEQTVGDDSSNDSHLPTTAYLKYSLTQQIYTAAEIVYKGRITAIAFKATSDISNARSLDIYMSHTSKTAFGSDTDWEIMGSVALVYSGTVSFANNAWTTITLEQPFEYDGTNNLNICVVDKTGGCETGPRTFGTYSTNANRALYICNDDNNYSSSVGDPNQLSKFFGNCLTTNNQIVFTIQTPDSAESLTISPDEISNFSYLEGQGPSQTHKLDIVGVDLENNITLTAPTNFEISSTEDGTYNSSLTIPRVTSKRNRNVQTWDFEDGLQGWTVVDVDGDGYNWAHDTELGGHGGSTGLIYSQSYVNGHGVVHPDNWLISPQVTLGGSFSLWAHPQLSLYHSEHFAILVSTTNTSSFTLLGEWTLSSDAWEQFSVDLSAFAGQTGYIAVRHYNCSNQFYINVDDFVLDPDATIVDMPVTITPATVFVRMKDNLSAGAYSGTLTASAGTGNNLNGSVSLSGEVIAVYNVTLTANPTEGGAVEGAGTYAVGTEVTVSAITNSPYTFINWTENSTVVSTNASYTFTVNADRVLVANFGLTKEILGYGNGTGNWYLIASPLTDNVAPTHVGGMITDDLGATATPETSTYDLYRFDQSAEREWQNYKVHYDDSENPFNALVNGQGYLYASKEDVTLTFLGTPNSDDAVNVSLSYTAGKPLAGFNLVGNPFVENATLDRSYYSMNAAGTDLVATAADGSTPIAPCTGVIVQATEANQSVTFSKVTRGEAFTSKGSLNIALSQNVSTLRQVQSSTTLLDNAIVSFDQGAELGKFYFGEQDANLYLPQDGKEYAIAFSEGLGEMPLNFKACKNGEYTLTVNPEGVEMAYLHLIDNKTGVDIDLLSAGDRGSAPAMTGLKGHCGLDPQIENSTMLASQSPAHSYTFTAKTTDYESRFKLVFCAKDASTGSAPDEPFAFISNGELIVNGEGTLQVIDVMGRVLVTRTVTPHSSLPIPHSSLTSGVYVLRLINGENVKTQKIVIRY